MKEDTVWQAIVEIMSNSELKRKRQLWYEVLTGGIRTVCFEKSRWRNKDNQKYSPELCFYPIEFLENWDKRTIPPHYKFPIRLSPMYSLGPDAWKKAQPFFDSEICMDYKERREGISNLLVEHFRPIFLKLKSYESAKRMYFDGELPDFAFRMPARQFIFDQDTS